MFTFSRRLDDKITAQFLAQRDISTEAQFKSRNFNKMFHSKSFFCSLNTIYLSLNE